MIYQRELWMRAILLIWALLWLQSANADYTLSVTPRFASEEMLERLAPLAQLLTARLHSEVDIVLAADFHNYAQRLQNGRFDIAFSNPNHYAAAADANEVIAMEATATESMLRGIIIVRANSPISSVRDLIGRPVAIVSWQSTAGFLSQKVFLEAQGIQPKAIKLQEAYGNKQENVIFSVYHGDVDAGFINEDALHIVDRYVPHGQIRVLARTTWLPNWAFSVRRTLPVMVKERIRSAILELQPTDPVLKALKVFKFAPAVDADYDVVRRALDLPVLHPLAQPAAIQPSVPATTNSTVVVTPKPSHKHKKRQNDDD